MSREQLYLAAFIVLMIILGLPAFVLQSTGGSQAPSTAQEESVLASVSVPLTNLDLARTTESEWATIRHERKININTADSSVLQTLPNVGPNRAEDIMGYRKEGNVFRNHQDLLKIDGFGVASMEKLRPRVRYGEDNYEEPSGGSTGGTINVNEASVDRLKSLDGVGSVTAQRMVDYREENGSFKSPEDLKAVSGLGNKTVSNFLGQIEDLPGGNGINGGSSTGKVNVNSAGPDELETLPGIGSVTARAIIEHREENGNFTSIDDLDQVSGIGPATVDKLRSRVNTE